MNRPDVYMAERRTYRRRLRRRGRLARQVERRAYERAFVLAALDMFENTIQIGNFTKPYGMHFGGPDA